jgi:hyperosmotically inducible protein
MCPSIVDLLFGEMSRPGKGSKMKVLESLKLVGVSMLVVFGLNACDKPGPAETAGKKMDQTANDAGAKIGETIDKADKKLSEQGAKAGVAIDDAGITTKVKGAILAGSGLSTLQISVDTVKGVVTLTGSVDSQASSDRVQAMAAAVEGVKEVNNRLVRLVPVPTQ